MGTRLFASDAADDAGQANRPIRLAEDIRQPRLKRGGFPSGVRLGCASIIAPTAAASLEDQRQTRTPQHCQSLAIPDGFRGPKPLRPSFARSAHAGHGSESTAISSSLQTRSSERCLAAIARAACCLLPSAAPLLGPHHPVPSSIQSRFRTLRSPRWRQVESCKQSQREQPSRSAAGKHDPSRSRINPAPPAASRPAPGQSQPASRCFPQPPSPKGEPNGLTQKQSVGPVRTDAA